MKPSTYSNSTNYLRLISGFLLCLTLLFGIIVGYWPEMALLVTVSTDTLYLGLFGLALSLLALYHWSITSPFKRLIQLMGAFDQGDYETPLFLKGHPSVEALSHHLDNLRLKLKYSQVIIRSDAKHRHYVEERLGYAVAHAEEASQIKSRFIQQITPSFEAPLKEIQSEIHEILKRDESLSPEGKTSCTRILSQADQLSYTLNSLLELAQLEKGTLQPDIEAVAVHQLCFDIFSEFNPHAKEASLMFQVIQDPTLPEYIYTDGARLIQILRNLLGNSFQFTSQGSVDLCVARPTNKEAQHYNLPVQQSFIGFSIEDSGKGVPKNIQETLSDPFSRTDSDESPTNTALGLGLSLSHHLALSLNGHLFVDSTDGKGSVFRLFIPVRPATLC